MKETVLATLRHHPFVADFEPRHVERLATLAKEVRFDRDQILFREGDDCSEFYLIVTGLVSLEIVAPGHTFRVQTLFAGDELGWSALLMGRGKNFQARTLERVDALAFEGTELLAACHEDTLWPRARGREPRRDHTAARGRVRGVRRSRVAQARHRRRALA